ncbi:MAG: VanW family protein [Ignavibacteriales bacterium]
MRINNLLKIISVLLTVAVLGLFFSSLNKGNAGNKYKANNIKMESKITKVNPKESNTVITEKKDKTASEEKSGPVLNEKLPWEDTPNFIAKKEKYKLNVRMAAFRTVLPDPLPGEEENVSIAADKIAGTIINPGEVFSQNNKAGPYTSWKGYKKGPTYSGGQLITTVGGGVCKIASTIYNVVIMSDLHVILRYPHSMIVPYVPPGQDATVYYGSRDIRFMNNKSYPILLWAKAEGNKLYMAIYGQENPPKVTWHHEILKEIKTYYIYKRNSDLPKGVKKVVMEGYKGYKVKTWITIEETDGSTKIKNLGVDWYSPFPGLIEVGTGN